jgi:hypothetical protein
LHSREPRERHGECETDAVIEEKSSLINPAKREDMGLFGLYVLSAEQVDESCGSSLRGDGVSEAALCLEESSVACILLEGPRCRATSYPTSVNDDSARDAL